MPIGDMWPRVAHEVTILWRYRNECIIIIIIIIILVSTLTRLVGGIRPVKTCYRLQFNSNQSRI